MVQVRDDYPLLENGLADIPSWLSRLPNVEFMNEQALAVLTKAAELAQTLNNNSAEGEDFWGEDYSRLYTGLEMAELLADLNLDVETLTAAILYRCVRDNALKLSAVKEQFSEPVFTLIEGVLQMAALSSSDAVFEEEQVLGSKEAQPEHMRKMLVAMVDDVRVALIKLAERTCAIREVKNNEGRRYKVAKEVFEVYAPLAHRLGIGHIKWELEDLSFRYLQPKEYKRIASYLDERRLERQQYIDEVIHKLRDELSDGRIDGEVNGRVKHIYSIWRKMQKKKLDFSQIYDIRAVRILVKEVRDCYTVLGIIHTLWKAIPNEFDDYIALPKENGYKSLHTAVFGDSGKVIEIQIRTYDMHEEAEFGVCAHWQYKGADGANSAGYEEKIAWLKLVLDEQEEESLPDELAQINQDKIYVFTPQGHVVELSQDATPLDFAYRVHTEIGHRTRGAKVNGRIVPLTYSLENGQQVEVITGNEPEPSREWLRPVLGYLKTSRAKAKVKAWFKKQDRSKNIAVGRALLDRELKRLSLTSLDYKSIADDIGFETVDDMYAKVGSGDKGTGQIVRVAQTMAEAGDSTHFELSSSQWRPAPKTAKPMSKDAIEVFGAGNMLTTMASCCQPVLGDDIAGFVTMGRGVSVHRQDCAQFLHLQDTQPERTIEVSFTTSTDQTWPVDIAIQAYDRPGLLSDVTGLLANEKVNVLAVSTFSNPADSTADMKLTIEVKGIDWLGRILAKMNRLPNIISVQRQLDSSKNKR